MRKKRARALAAALLMLAFLGGCGAEAAPSESPSAVPEETERPSESPEPAEESPSPSPAEEPEILLADGAESIGAELERAMSALEQPRPMDITGAGLGEQPELDVRNIYYSLQSENRAFSTAYDIGVSVENGIMTVDISYMPYVTGDFPEGFAGTEVSGLPGLIEAAEEGLGGEPLQIKITDSGLIPDELNAALQQVGGGYVNCTLSRDGTAVTYAPAAGLSMEQALSAQEECRELAESAAAQLLDEDMDVMERAAALYGYLTENVSYDQRYYTDRWSVPIESQTALGALRDGLAICGGYAHALKLLFEAADIPCITVSGTYSGEYHMWNAAPVGDGLLYFDATADRGAAREYWRYFGVGADGLYGHDWDEALTRKLL